MADGPSDEVGAPSGRRRWWIGPLLVGAAVGLSVAGVLALLVQRGPAEPASAASPDFGRGTALAWAPGERPAPEVTLRDQDGKEVALSSLRGHLVLLAFLNTFCTDICPVQGRQLADLVGALPPQRRPTVVAVSVNPNDTPSSARAAAHDWGWNGLRWHWLMGSRSQLRPAWRDYGIIAKPSDGNEQVQHTGALYLIDASGDVRAAYTVPIPLPHLLGDIETLENGSGA